MSSKAVAKKTTDTAVTVTTPMDMIANVISDPNFDVAKLEKMMDLQERWEDRQAEQAFARAMAGFASDCPAIHRSKKADRFTYAPLEEIMETITPALKKHGLSVSFDSEFSKDGYLTTTCTVLHTAGHKRTSSYATPVDPENKTKLNVMQVQGSAQSYGRRYALSNALALVYCDEDDNAEAVYERLSLDQQTVINDLLIEIWPDQQDRAASQGLFLKWAKAKSVEEIPAVKYEPCVRRLKEIRSGQA